MSSPPGWNPHKKGEHVFNDIAGSLENAFLSALTPEQGHSLLLVGRYGSLRVHDVPQTITLLKVLQQDRILLEARTVVAPASGVHDDPNSRIYSEAKLKLERALSEIVVSTAALLWKKKPRPNSSFHEFESIVAGVRNSIVLRTDANAAIDTLIDSAHDPQAEASALSERISDSSLAARQAKIEALKQHRPALKKAGHALVGVFSDEIERVLERRIGAA